MSRTRGSLHLAMLVVLVMVTVVPPADAANRPLQHLVSPGDDWSKLIDRVEPGHEIILMPGEHMSASFDELQGEPDNPITIRSVSPNHRATIRASRKGIRLREPRHVVIRDLIITDATISGISISGPDADISSMLRGGNWRSNNPEHSERLQAPWHADVTIDNVTIERTGPRGQRHAVRLAALDGVRIIDSHIRGWGGSAIHVIACRNVRIERCTLVGTEDLEHRNGIELRAGSRDIQIHRCTIENPGVAGIAVGGESRAREFRPPLDNASHGTQQPNDRRYEAKDVRISRCIIRGASAGFVIQHVMRCAIRNNYIERANGVMYLVMDDSDLPLMGVSHGIEFVANMFLWEPGDLRALAYAASDANIEGITLQRNLWWSADLAERKDALGEPVGTVAQEQVMDIDPAPDANGRPSNRQAAAFGPRAP